MGKILKKSDLNKFLYKLKTTNELIAPVKRDVTRFESIKFISQISLSEIPAFSFKKFFIESTNEEFAYKDTKIIVPKKIKSRVIFGARLCDTSAITALDKVLLGKHPNEQYLERREKTTIIGIQCAKETEKNCFCTSMNIRNGADLFFHDIGENYYIESYSEKGRKLVSRLKDYHYEPENIRASRKLEKKDITKYYDDKAWQKAAEKCISCGICTNVCPTCACYKPQDIAGIDGQSGKRISRWISCQRKEFWKNNDDTFFFEEKTEMFKHRIYHKLVYFKKRYGTDMCTGCGRCITQCPAGIDFVEIINNIG